MLAMLLRHVLERIPSSQLQPPLNKKIWKLKKLIQSLNQVFGNDGSRFPWVGFGAPNKIILFMNIYLWLELALRSRTLWTRMSTLVETCMRPCLRSCLRICLHLSRNFLFCEHLNLKQYVRILNSQLYLTDIVIALLSHAVTVFVCTVVPALSWTTCKLAFIVVIHAVEFTHLDFWLGLKKYWWTDSRSKSSEQLLQLSCFTSAVATQQHISLLNNTWWECWCGNNTDC